MSIVISGAGGQLGRKVVEELRERVGASEIVALSRDPGKIANLGVETRRADFDDREGLVEAFAGADRLLLISTDRVGQRVAQHANAIDAAVRAGVGHLFYTSITLATDEGNPAMVAPEHRATEEALAASGLPFTALRNNLYTDFLLPTAQQAIATGVYTSNGGNGGASYVTRDDLATATAAILAVPAAPRGVLELTGQEAVTGAQFAAILSELAGKEIRFQSLTDEQSAAGMAAAGLPPEMVALYNSFGTAQCEGYFDLITDVVQRYLGRTPTSVAAFLTTNRTALVA